LQTFRIHTFGGREVGVDMSGIDVRKKYKKHTGQLKALSNEIGPNQEFI
jgi:hypothetical protein